MITINHQAKFGTWFLLSARLNNMLEQVKPKELIDTRYSWATMGKNKSRLNNEDVAHLSIRSTQNTMGIRELHSDTETCVTVGERAQVIIVWVMAPSVGNTSHPRRLGVTMVRP
jgi:hypothetical protein